jgi:hypothetical protein
MNELGLKFSLQHDEHMYLWFTSCWWTTCFYTKPMEVNGNVGIGIDRDGMSTIDCLLLAKLKKKILHNVHNLISSLGVYIQF